MKKYSLLIFILLLANIACKKKTNKSIFIEVNANSKTIDNAPEYEPKIEGIGQIVAINEKENKSSVSTSIDVSKLQSGIYFLEVKHGERSTKTKFLKN